MTRAGRFVLTAIVGMVVWLAVYAGYADALLLNVLGRPQHVAAAHEVVKGLPAYVLIVLGCYACYAIGSALFTFRDCPEAAEELKHDVQRAKAALRKKGYKAGKE